MDTISRVEEIYRREGPKSLLISLFANARNRPKSFYYQTIRPKFSISDEEMVFNGVKTRPFRTVDKYIPLSLPVNGGGHKNPSEYETALCDALRTYLQEGDEVTIVGAGLGVTSIVAANQVGSKGNVVCYEGAKNMIEHLQKTVDINNSGDEVEINHAIVGESVHLEGKSKNSGIVEPSDLSPCDVLELDCEGAETKIIPSLTIRPEYLIVETHGNTDQVKSQVIDLGYEILSKEPAEVGPYLDLCEKNGVFVVVGERKNESDNTNCI